MKSRINTNLSNKVMGVGQRKFGKEVKQIMEQNEYRDRESETVPADVPAVRGSNKMFDHQYKKMEMYQIEHLHRENKKFATRTKAEIQ